MKVTPPPSRSPEPVPFVEMWDRCPACDRRIFLLLTKESGIAACCCGERWSVIAARPSDAGRTL